MAGILIVDDDPTIRAMFSRALKALGDIDQAGNGAEALRLLATKKYDVVLLDLHMPIIDGFVLLHTIANKPGQNRDTPIYVITADTSEQARIRALKRRAVYMLTKPVPIATLTALVESALQKGADRGSRPLEGDDAVIDVGPPSAREGSSASKPPLGGPSAALSRPPPGSLQGASRPPPGTLQGASRPAPALAPAESPKKPSA